MTLSTFPTDQIRRSVRPADGELAPDVLGVKCGIVNLALVGTPGAGDRGWVLVDAGLPGFAGKILRAAESRFGPGARPSAIVLTHGHFDHIGALHTLLKHWPDTPVFAHPLELPYLTGKSAYPPADPSVGGGLLTLSSPLFPPGPFDFSEVIHPFPADLAEVGLPGWEVVETPGHSPGHVSFFRPDDGTLLAGDAFVTTKQESALASLSATPYIQGPPWYYTPDWPAARASVETLLHLKPARALTGHGPALDGDAALTALTRVLHGWGQPGITPNRGRYWNSPALTDQDGVRFTPPKQTSPLKTTLLLTAALGLALGILWTTRRRTSR